MNYLRIVDGEPQEYSLSQFRRDNKKKSLPQSIRSSTLERYGIYPYVMDEVPEYNPSTEKPVESEFYQDHYGKWRRSWTIVEVEVYPERVYDFASRLLNQVTITYSPEEKETWTDQRRDAETFLSDPNAEAPYVRHLAAAERISEREMAERILEKANRTKELKAKILAARNTILASRPIPQDFTDSRYWPPELLLLFEKDN